MAGLFALFLDLLERWRKKREDRKVWDEYVESAAWLKSAGGNCWLVPLGSDHHRVCEEFVRREWAVRGKFPQTYFPLA